MPREHGIMFAPSILSADHGNLMADIRKVRKAEYLHIDVMDGHFVPEITIGPRVVKAIKRYLEEENVRQRLDAHLMITNPGLQVDKFVLAGADIITVHAEVTGHLHRLLTRIRELGAMAGVALNPATPLSFIEEVVEDLDLLLIMTVNPGYGGQSFIPTMLPKIERASRLLKKENPHAILEVDGGVNVNNVSLIVDAGAELLVAGSAVFNSDPEKSLEDLRRAAKGEPKE